MSDDDLQRFLAMRGQTEEEFKAQLLEAGRKCGEIMIKLLKGFQPMVAEAQRAAARMAEVAIAAENAKPSKS